MRPSLRPWLGFAAAYLIATTALSGRYAAGAPVTWQDNAVARTSEAPPRVFLIVADISGSMKGKMPQVGRELEPRTRLEEVKGRLQELAGALPDNCRTIVTVFDKTARQVCDITLQTEADRQSLRDAVQKIESDDGVTYLWRTLDSRLAAATALAKADPGRPVRLLLYSDGEDTEKNSELDHQTIIKRHGDFLKQHIQVDVVTLGYDMEAAARADLEDYDVRFHRAVSPKELVPVHAGMLLSTRTIRVGQECRVDDNSLVEPSGARRLDWGDGTSTTGPFPAQHVYEQPGRYRLQLTVEAEDGRSDTSEETVQVVLPPGPAARISGSMPRTTLQAGEQMILTDTSSSPVDSPLQRAWSVNGRTVAGALPTLTVPTDQPGALAVELTVTDEWGQTDSARVRLEVELPPAPTSRIFISEQRVLPGQTVVLTAETAAPMVEWNIDGTSFRTKQVRWTAPNSAVTVPVGLTVRDQWGQTSTTTESVEVVLPPAPQAKFRIPVLEGVDPGDTITLISRSLGNPVSWEWQIGGQVIRDEHASWVVPGYGTHALQLTVGDRFGQTSSVTGEVAIMTPPKPIAEFQLADEYPAETRLVLADTAADPTVTSRRWYRNEELIGEGITLECPAHPSGRFTFRLEADNAGGTTTCAQTTVIRNYDSPLAGFTVGNRSPQVGDELVITDTASGRIDDISFVIEGAGADAEVQTISQRERSARYFVIRPSTAGPVHILQTVTGPGGTTIAEDTISVQPRYAAPQARFTMARSDATGSVRFVSASTGDAASVRFRPGDGSPAREYKPGELIEYDYEPGVYQPVIELAGMPGYPASVWSPETPLDIPAPTPEWVRRLLWQTPLALCAVTGVVVLLRRHQRSRQLLESLIIRGRLTVRSVDDPLNITTHEFAGIQQVETVPFGNGREIRIESQPDEWGEANYIATLLIDGVPSDEIELPDGLEQPLADHVLTYLR